MRIDKCSGGGVDFICLIIRSCINQRSAFARRNYCFVMVDQAMLNALPQRVILFTDMQQQCDRDLSVRGRDWFNYGIQRDN